MIKKNLLNVIQHLIGLLQRGRLYLIRQIAYAKKDKALENNITLKNRFAGSKCFILGNAPSLAKHDLSLLTTEAVFVVNSFYVSEQIRTVKPKYYVIADPFYCKLEDPIILDWWRDFTNKTKGNNLSYFLNVKLKDTAVGEMLSGETVYYLDISLPFYNGCSYKFDISLPVNGVQNVLILCLQLAIYMGYKDIYLLGADHSWLSHYGEDRHFYDPNKVRLQESSGSLQYPYHWWLSAVNEMFQEYKEVDHYAKNNEIYIFNASEAGVLDVFPFITFKEALNKGQ